MDAQDLRLSGPAGSPAASAPIQPPSEQPPQEAPLEFETSVPYEVGRPPKTDAGFWDVAGAAWTAETIRTDAWDYMGRKRKALSSQMYDLLSPGAKDRIAARRFNYGSQWATFEQLVLDEAAKERAADPARWAGLPASKDEFDARVRAERQAEFAEAQTVLDQPGGGFAEFLGSSARAMTDEVNVLLAPLGLEGSALRIIGSQAALGAAGEAAVLPRENQVAAEMGLPAPDAWTRIGMGAVLGGGLTAGLLGAGRAFRWVRDRRMAARALAPTERGGLEAEIAVDAAEAQLRGQPTVQETVTPGPQPVAAETPAGPVEFDYRPQGNASPRNNRVGYAYGKLIEMGYEPHIAAGIVGNLMQESGPSLNTRIVGDGGASIGLAQWNGARRRELERFAAKRGTSPDDLDTQLAFVDWELKNTEAGAWAQISQAATARDAALAFSQHYERPGTPHNARRVAYAEAIDRQWRDGQVPKWDGATVLPEGGAPYTPYRGTSRGYTGEGQVAVGDEFRIDVEYQVVDLGSLTRASGDLQPRDRTGMNSDAWIADTAARLDPALLMPSPTADRGAPLVGPDNIIESGNGRTAAIERAYALHPDRAQAYRAQIEAGGFVIPEGVERPVLIARRKTEWTPDQRRKAVQVAQDSGVAALTPAELAQMTGRAMTPAVLDKLDPSLKVKDAGNAAFHRAVMELLPRSARNALYDAKGGLNSYGKRQLTEALFARAWPDPGLLARFIEGEEGDLGSLLSALGRAAPSWAQLKADIEAGLVRPEFDISTHVTDAARIVMAARDLARREKMGIGAALAEILDEVDQVSGPWSPLTAALVKKLWRDGRAVPEDRVVEFLTGYAREARVAGRDGGMFGGPGPRDVLVRLDAETFGALPEEFGAARGYARPTPRPVEDTAATGFDQGAASPEAEAADAEIAADLLASPAGAEAAARVEEITQIARRELAAAGSEADLRQALKDYEANARQRAGQSGDTPLQDRRQADADQSAIYARLAAFRPSRWIERAGEIPPAEAAAIAARDPIGQWTNQIHRLERTTDHILASPEFDQLAEFAGWRGDAQPGRTSNGTPASASPSVPDAAARAQDASPASAPQARPGALTRTARDLATAATALADPDAAARRALADMQREFGDLEIDLPDGTRATVREVLADLEDDAGFDAFIQACAIIPGGAR